MAAEIPVYLFTGFLDGGKTTFIQSTLEDERFNKGERTLLLLCEEGEVEYDPSRFSGKNVSIEPIEDKSALTADALTALQKKHRAQRVMIEYNGMWLLSDLFSAMPKNWTIYQEMMFADASTFAAYNANMRSLVVDKLGTPELVVFTRMPREQDKLPLHKIVRGGADKSFGIDVAKLAGLPEALISRARALLSLLEEQSSTDLAGIDLSRADAQAENRRTEQEERVLSALRAMDINSLTPLEALSLLNDLRQKVLEDN